MEGVGAAKANRKRRRREDVRMRQDEQQGPGEGQAGCPEIRRSRVQRHPGEPSRTLPHTVAPRLPAIAHGTHEHALSSRHATDRRRSADTHAAMAGPVAPPPFLPFEAYHTSCNIPIALTIRRNSRISKATFEAYYATRGGGAQYFRGPLSCRRKDKICQTSNSLVHTVPSLLRLRVTWPVRH